MVASLHWRILVRNVIYTYNTNKNIRSADLLLLLLPYFVLYSWKRNFSKHACREDRGMRIHLVISGILNQLLIITVSIIMYYIISRRYNKRLLKCGLYNVSMDVSHKLIYIYIICIAILLKSYYRCEFDGEVLSCYEKTLKMHVNMHPPQRVVAFCISCGVVDF